MSAQLLLVAQAEQSAGEATFVHEQFRRFDEVFADLARPRGPTANKEKLDQQSKVASHRLAGRPDASRPGRPAGFKARSSRRIFLVGLIGLRQMVGK
ncbi:MAG: hypothetical protein RL077_4876 [Verrucomicrobiota bacterium]